MQISQKRKQKLNEPYCGPITYCAISGKPVSLVRTFHKKASINPSIGFFYLSFHKLDKNAYSHIEQEGSILDSKDIKCFDTMWEFEKPFQKISKQEFINQVLISNQALYKRFKKNIRIYSKMDIKDYRTILTSNLKQNRSVGTMIMIDINKYTKKPGEFFIPHWITVHGFKDKNGLDYRIFNSYDSDSQWLKEKDLFALFDLNRKYHFSPQFVYIR